MSKNARLKVGGLALTLHSTISKNNEGLVVVIKEFREKSNLWVVSNEDLVDFFGNVAGLGLFSTDQLLPLGDEEMNEIFIKESEDQLKDKLNM